ncbi:hypothetical protein CQY20_01340 [Mycolicibacterium agri]|uniref:DUF2599 domain-containing protein n=1 Tax=Mycolicibacterium agri TaxID=36811 RepID=A0A2A7NFN2_MYCAG|nr:DUF2599 domain-containing protein [Mycolicibacterium agri]PEG42670.1 hypothetical protein CQY20_01340 [Mycolicibacterium agri]GFG52646.1 hypothetical protein MAGR_40870 [Mycolicibacterium agri]
MRRVLAATAAAMIAALATPVVAAADTTVPGPPYVAHAEWAKWGDLSSLRVYPTDSARAASTQPGTTAQADQMWAEVLTVSPDADIAGMREQFMCHWHYAELAYPGKESWNLEPWRPEVSWDEMLASHCNPGGTEEPF